MAVAFLKFFISHELESTMWHTKQSGHVTLVNRIHVADIFHLGSTFQLSFAPFALNFSYVKVKVEKNQALVAQIYSVIHQGPVFFLKVDNTITRCLPLQKVNGTRLFVSLYWKISESNRTSEKVVLFFRTECSKRGFVLHLLKLIFDTSYR